MNSGLYLLASVGGTDIVLPAEAVEAVVRFESVVPVPCSPPCIIGLAAIRSRVLTLLDTAMIAGAGAVHGRLMAVCSVDGHGYGLALDEVEDVIAIASFTSSPNRLGSGWAAIVDGMADHRGRPVLLLRPERIAASVATPRREAA